jgi:zinc protease
MTWTLENGLEVYALPEPGGSSVAVQVWYRVGSKDDPAGRSGFAHLFEHLMFKRTKNMRDEMLDRLTEDVGGENNAFTSADVTVYHEIVPANHLERLLWAEADRMVNLQVEESNFASERDVVKEEYRQGVLANPYGLLEDAIERHSWSVHPYQRPTIGNLSELNSATLEDVRTFYKTYYRPDNAILIVSGAFAESELRGWVEKYFGPVLRPETPIVRNPTREPERTGEKRFRATAPNVPLPALAMSFLTVPASHPDADALKILDATLSGGESARFHQSLVYSQQIASEASTGADLRLEGGLFTVNTVAAGGKTLAALEKATLTELEKVKSAPPSSAELERAKIRLLTALLKSRESVDGKAFALGEAVLEGDARRADTALKRLVNVTGEDVQRVARKYLTAENRVVVRYESGPAPAGASIVGEKPKTLPSTVAPGALVRPPAPGPAHAPVLPTPIEKTLRNGLKVAVASQPGSGLVTARIVVRAGSAHDPVRKDGLASLTASLLTRGTKSRTATEQAQAIEALGGSLEIAAGRDQTDASVTVALPSLDGAVALLADALLHPAFSSTEVARRRAEAIDERTVALQEPGTLARLAAQRLQFGPGAYGRATDGLPQTLKRITRTDVQKFHRMGYTPDNATLLLCGDLTPEAGFALAEKHFSLWRRTYAGKLPRPSYGLGPIQRRVVVIDAPELGQSAVVLIRPALERKDPSWTAAQLANSLYGGGYSSRLNVEVRIKRGLSYGAGSGVSGGAGVGALVAACQTKHESAGEVARLFVDELARLAQAPADEIEFSARRSALVGPYARLFETTEGLAGMFGPLAGLGMPLSEAGRLLTQAKNLGPADIQRLAARKLGAPYASLVVVGDARKFLPDLKKRLGRVEVIPRKALNLESPMLK